MNFDEWRRPIHATGAASTPVALALQGAHLPGSGAKRPQAAGRGLHALMATTLVVVEAGAA
jgi:hypothetical protein